MNSILGQSLVFVGLACAAFGSAVGFVGGRRNSPIALLWARRATYAFALAMLAANFVMEAALLRHDFSVGYVAQVGSRSTPLHITIVSLWSALEGSILFWGMVLGAFAAAFAYSQRRRHDALVTYALATMLVVGAFFALLLSGPANPFHAVSPVPDDGPGPNPLLQNHPLMIVHPPMLYLGYVGMTVPFAVAVAALLRAELSDSWLKVLRRSTMVAWTFLSAGIILGGWWAYEVLGWGGYWAWDPVENASFLPWLAATGYLHSTVVQERRRMLKAWTLSLVVAAFLLTILGTFMTRSGVFNSVHSFTQSPIGPVFFVFFLVVTVASVALLAGRAHLLTPEDKISAVLSRETAFVVNNVLFVTFTFTVLLGTIFPLITEAVRGVQVSVGEPYFDTMAVPVSLALVFLMGVGPVLPWGQPVGARIARELALPAGVGLGLAVLLMMLGVEGALALLTFGLCGFAGTVTLRELLAPIITRARRRNEGALVAAAATLRGQRRKVGGYVVHLAVIIIVAAIAGSQSYKRTADASLAPGESVDVGPYTVTFVQATTRQEPHRYALSARLSVHEKGEPLAELQPALNFYSTQREPIGTPAVRTIAHSDLYVSLLHVEPDGSRIGLKIFFIPLVPYIWWALPLLVLGSAVALWPRRRAVAQVAPAEGVPA